MNHCAARYWRLPSGSHLTDLDWIRCKTLADRGCRSVLVFSFYSLTDVERLLDLGYRDLQLRLWHNKYEFPERARYQQFIRDAKALCDRYSARLSVCPLNEPNAELVIDAELVRDWLTGWRLWARSEYPDVELIAPALCRSASNAYLWLEVLRDEYAAWDSVGCHYYWATSGDLIAGADWSPEWMRERFPTMPIRVTEAGGGDGTSRQWRYDTYPAILDRWGALDYLVSVAVYLMSAEDPKWEQLGHTYDDRIVGILGDAASRWPAKQLPEIKREQTMWDRHTVFDKWMKVFGGQGYNPADAFGQIIKENPDKQYGAFAGGYQLDEPFIYAFTTVGIFCFDKRSGLATFATSEEELPVA